MLRSGGTSRASRSVQRVATRGSGGAGGGGGTTRPREEGKSEGAQSHKAMADDGAAESQESLASLDE
eukprot:3602135-Prymnesium_polylepis.1